MILGIIIGFLVSILIVVTQIYLKLQGHTLDRVIKRLPKQGAIIKRKPIKEKKTEEIINLNEKQGKDTPLEDIL